MSLEDTECIANQLPVLPVASCVPIHTARHITVTLYRYYLCPFWRGNPHTLHPHLNTSLSLNQNSQLRAHAVSVKSNLSEAWSFFYVPTFFSAAQVSPTGRERLLQSVKIEMPYLSFLKVCFRFWPFTFENFLLCDHPTTC